MQPYWVSIMASRGKTLYVGVTRDLKRRAREHKNGIFGGFTAKYNVTRLVYFEVYREVATALQREKQVKAFRRQKKLDLIESVNPKWDDLATFTSPS
jgi:putative endonuclease